VVILLPGRIATQPDLPAPVPDDLAPSIMGVHECPGR